MRVEEKTAGRANGSTRLAAALLVLVGAALPVAALFAVPPGAMAGLAFFGAAVNVNGGVSRAVNSFFDETEKPAEEAIAPQKSESKEVNLPERAATGDNSGVQSVRLTEVDGDILALIEGAKIDFADDKEDGKISEYTFGAADATSAFGSVTVRNVTSTKSINIEKELANASKVDFGAPTVLIFHTHTTEGFEILDRGFYAADYVSRTQDEAKSIVRVGTEIAEQLEKAGIKVIHDKTLFDLTYSGAYDRSRKMVQKYLKEYPDIRVVLDVHRDAIHRDNGVKVKPVSVIDGKKAAQIMLIAGAEEKNVENFPNWQKNLQFDVLLHKTCEELFPGLMRPIFFCARKYNMDLTPCSVLVEVGSDANTLDEAVYAGRLFGVALGELMGEK